MKRFAFLIALAIAFPLTVHSAARAVSVQNGARNVPYVIAFKPMNSQTHPFLGQMHLNFNNGIISGTYTDMSVRPGSPFANAHNIAVSGGVSKDHLTLLIRQVSFRGTMSGEKMSGSATIRGTIYTFEAHQGSPGSGK